MKDLEDLAFDLVREVHRRLGHVDFVERVSREEFALLEIRKAVWIEVARMLDERFASDGRWLEDYAFTIWQRAHERAGNVLISASRETFDCLQPQERRRVWCEIARLLDERLRADAPTWRMTLNTDLETPGLRWGHISTAFNEARRLGYPHVLWNGWIYRVFDEERVCLAEELLGG